MKKENREKTGQKNRKKYTQYHTVHCVLLFQYNDKSNKLNGRDFKTLRTANKHHKLSYIT